MLRTKRFFATYYSLILVISFLLAEYFDLFPSGILGIILLTILLIYI